MKKLIYLFVLILQLIPFTSSAKNTFTLDGTVNSIDFKSGAIVIDDIAYKLGQTVAVYDQNNGIISQQNVKVGTKVGFSTSSKPASGSNTYTIYELWVLPMSYKLDDSAVGPVYMVPDQ